MAEAARALFPASTLGAARVSPMVGARRPVAQARLRRVDAPVAAGEAEPAAEATDYTGFSMIGVAG